MLLSREAALVKQGCPAVCVVTVVFIQHVELGFASTLNAVDNIKACNTSGNCIIKDGRLRVGASQKNNEHGSTKAT